MSDVFYLSYTVMWLLVLVQGVLLLLVYRHFGLAALGTFEGVQRDGLSIGQQVPPISATGEHGQPVSWQPNGQQAHLLMFVSPDCEPCANIAPYLNALGTAGSSRSALSVAGIVAGGEHELARFVAKTSPSYDCFADVGLDATNAYRVRVTPCGFVIGADGRVLAKGLCSDHKKLEALVGAAGIELGGDVLAPVPIVVKQPDGRLVERQR